MHDPSIGAICHMSSARNRKAYAVPLFSPRFHSLCRNGEQRRGRAAVVEKSQKAYTFLVQARQARQARHV
jgi:hypothetical protein